MQAAHDELQHLARRAPRACRLAQTRWTLQAFRHACSWLAPLSLAGVQSLLQRLGITWQRARSYIHSPDASYQAKLAWVQAVRMLARQAERQVVVVYLDEVTIERQPSLAATHAPQGGGAAQPRACWSTASTTLTRVLATLEHGSGRVVYHRASKITIAVLVQFFQQLRAAYPDAERVYVVLDNWPVHFHPDVLVALEEQERRYFRPLPPSWSAKPSATARKRWGQLQLPIQLVPLPTYASWCNPIEQLWRKLRQELTHLHRWAHDLSRLRAEIDRFLDQFADGSESLLRYVGLAIPD